MNLPPENPDAFLHLLREGAVGLEFVVDRQKNLADIGSLSDDVSRIRYCRALVVTASVYGRWAVDEPLLDGGAAASARRLRRAMHEGRGEDASRALVRLVENLRLLDPRGEKGLRELDFRFAGAYLENPLHLRFLGYGTVACLGLCVTTLAAAQLMKERDAMACRAQVDGMARTQFEMLQSLARSEGRWTERHAESHKATVDAARVASLACGSVLSGIEFRLHLPPGIDYEVRLGPTPSNPGP